MPPAHNKSRKFSRALLCGIALAVWVCLIFANSMIPGTQSHRESRTVLKAASSVMKDADARLSRKAMDIYAPLLPRGGSGDGDFFIRKTAHLAEYAVLGILCLLLALRLRGARRRRLKQLPRRKRQSMWLWLLALGPAVALVDEMVVQRFLVTGRTSSLPDAGLDTVGFALGCALCLLAGLALRFVRKQRRPVAKP